MNETTFHVEDQGTGTILGAVVPLSADSFLVTFRDQSKGLYFWLKGHSGQRSGDGLYFTWDDIRRVSLHPLQENGVSDPLYVDWIRVGLSLPGPDEYGHYMRSGENGEEVVDVVALDEFIDKHPEPLLTYVPRPGRPGELSEHLVNDHLATSRQRIALLKARKVLADFLPGMPKPGAPIGNNNHNKNNPEYDVPDEILNAATQKPYKSPTTGTSHKNFEGFASTTDFSPKVIRTSLRRHHHQKK